jgi:DnaJ-domain-containing protein 1
MTKVLDAFSEDFSTLLMVGKARENIKGYENAIRAMHTKMDAIKDQCNPTLKSSVQKAWDIFYASIVAPMREDLFPKEMEKRRQEKAERERQREQWQSWRNYEAGYGWEDFMGGFYNRIFRTVFTDTIATQFKVLGLAITATVEDVKSAYRKLALLHHPDRGGDRAKFEEATEAKEKCLKYIGGVAS